MAEPLAHISPGACARTLPSTSKGINGSSASYCASWSRRHGARLGLIGLNRMLRSAVPFLIQVEGCSADGDAVSSVRNAPGVVPVSARSARVRWA
jgi:hypothetical protein